jgi:hypothetical protein
LTADRKPRHPDLINADAALERAAQRALDLALQTRHAVLDPERRKTREYRS